ncbi:MAG: aminotransferase class V-fold PLP-dependent enzyme [Gemmataceae bacterium]|nr:aminotransferase class V-fold PLP-dependent enzyme [Gemmataceae bacterium]
MNALPALLGGPPVRPNGPPDWPIRDEEVQQALQAAWLDGSWGKYHGSHVERLEQALCAYHGCAFALTCGSGTFAVELALRALQIGPDDEVILAAYDYPGNFLGVHALGARPVLVDVDPDNWNLDPARLGGAVGPATRAVIVSHLHGGVVPMGAVMAFAGAHGLAVIEDAAQAPGALIEGRRAGTWGDVGVLSFGGSKLLSAGRGGAVLTARADLHQRARTWVHRGNHLCPLSELQAAALLPQLAKLDVRNARRTQSVELLSRALRPDLGLRLFANRAGQSAPGYYKVGFQFDSGRFGLSRERFVAALRAEGIAFDEGFRALHVGRSPKRFRRAGELSESERAHEGTVILHHPVLLGEPGEVEQVAEALHKVHRWAQSGGPRR